MSKRILRAAALGAVVVVFLAGCFTSTLDGALVITFPGGLPDGVTAINYTIVGAEFDDLTGSITGSSDEPIIVPPGDAREYTVVVDVDNATPVTQYTAHGTFNVLAGEPTEVSAQLFVTATKLVIPDSVNGRIVQIDDIASGASWQEATAGEETIDLEVGPDARIYYVQRDYNPQTFTSTSIIRAKADIDSAAQTIFNNVEYFPDQIGIDHANDLIYVTESRSLYRVGLDGTTLKDYSSAIASTLDGSVGGENAGILAVTVADDGIVYVLFSDDSAGDTASVFEFDPSGDGAVVDSSVIFSETFSGVAYNEADIVAKGDTLFVLLQASEGETATVLEVSRDLVSTGSYGTPYDPQLPSQPADVLYGPSRFVGHRNPEIQFIDEDDVYYEVDHLVQLDDITGQGRQTYGGLPGNATGEFDFFYQLPQ